MVYVQEFRRLANTPQPPIPGIERLIRSTEKEYETIHDLETAYEVYLQTASEPSGKCFQMKKQLDVGHDSLAMRSESFAGPAGPAKTEEEANLTVSEGSSSKSVMSHVNQ